MYLYFIPTAVVRLRGGSINMVTPNLVPLESLERGRYFLVVNHGHAF